MAIRNDFEALRSFDQEVLDEIVREAELYLQAQFTAAGASDQRGMAWAGFMIASTTAALAAAASLVVSGGHIILAITSLGAAAMLLLSTFLAAKAVRPNKFCFPGNRPANWLPENWHGNGVGTLDIKQARLEQAHTLEKQICDNVEWAEEAGKLLHHSMDVAMAAVLLAGCVVVIGLCFGLL
ncbi:hypothetical protein [Sphingobium xenophagum]|uniref:hypothetical protein n=1 Tax=Sphingobium xenophagum TaxID=121428 RepID=UPI0012F834E4|nr:hypothetical protein [Sphingobium xenophagum]